MFKIVTTRRLPALSLNVRRAYSQGKFEDKERAHEGQYARDKERRQLDELRKKIEQKKKELELLEKEHQEEVAKSK